MRPWKAEQLGGGYAVSSWVERTAYEAAAAVIAVSAAMRDDVLRAYPAVDPDRVHVVHNGIDTELLVARRPTPTGCARWASTRTGRRSSSSAGSPGRRGCRSSCARAPSCRRTCRWCSAPGAPDTPEIEAEVEGLVDGLRDSRDGRRLDPRDAPPRRRRRAADRRDGVRLPVDLRAARHRQPRGDGLRDRRRRHRDRRHPRGRRRPALRPGVADGPPPGGWCRSSRPPTAPARRSTRTATSPTSPPRSPRSSPTPTGPPRWAGPAGQRAIDAFSWAAIAERTVEVYRSVLLRPTPVKLHVRRLGRRPAGPPPATSGCTQRLAGAGVRRLQLNLDDADVAPAMRHRHRSEHIARDRERLGRDADADVTEVLAERDDQAGRLGGRRAAPIPPPETAGTASGWTRWPTSRCCSGPTTSTATSGCTAGWSTTPRSRSRTQATLRLRAEHRDPARSPTVAPTRRRARRGAVPERRAWSTCTRSTAAAATTPS